MPGPRTFAFVTLHATGPDVAVDRVFRLAARLPDGAGGSESIDWLASPHGAATTAAAEAVSARLHRRYGLSGRDFDGRPPATALFDMFRGRLGDRTLIVYDREGFLHWWKILRRRAAMESGVDTDPADPFDFDADIPCVIGVADLARLLLPGRRSAERESLLHLAFAPGEVPARDLLPQELEHLLGALCRAILSKSAPELAIVASAISHLIYQLRATDPGAAAVFEASLDAVDRPSAWRTRNAELFPAAAELLDGMISARAGSTDQAIDAFASARPRMSANLDEQWLRDPVADASPEPVALDGRAMQAIDLVFETLLPRAMAAIAGHADPGRFYRKHQHALARRIGEALSKNEILLIDAPTGTGKTMAYLVPALLWARAAGVRVGISTYTVALQEQVFDRELPRALHLLRQAGALELNEIQGTVLKGRERYICNRALESAAPDASDPPEAWLAWTLLALFALDDPEGDLDRISRNLPGYFEKKEKGEDTFYQLMRDVRCRPNCCDQPADRKRCGAWVARRRAERSHFVVTNHAFVLRDPLFLRTLVLDECDHVHAQARGAASIEISLPSVADEIVEFAGPIRPGARTPRGTLPKLEKYLLQGEWFESSAAGALCTEGRRRAAEAAAGLEALQRAGAQYAQFVQAASQEAGFDAPGLFESFACEQAAGAELVAARTRLASALAALSGVANDLAASVEMAPIPNADRLRARLLRSAHDLGDLAVKLQEWLPLDDGKLKFDRNCFYDLEVSAARGRETAMTAKRSILLPNRWLAERYYPSMQSVVLMSASTWLGGGFDLSKNYLGLDLVERGTESREPRAVATHRSPQTFDYSRVLLAIPDDIPQASFGSPSGRRAFDDYLQQFLPFLVERTRGRTLVLLTNLQQCRALGRALAPALRERCIPFFYQGMEGRSKEELPRLFRSSEGGVLMGVDTFWYGVDFPGELLEYLVIAKLPFAAPDRYSRAQEIALGKSKYLQQIYLPEALSMFRQGFGRLMRRETDRGAAFLLDTRVLSRWRRFLAELPGTDAETFEPQRLQVFTGSTEDCVREALSHCGRIEECRRLGLALQFRIAGSS
jgi:Rad3-related DNA helicase